MSKIDMNENLRKNEKMKQKNVLEYECVLCRLQPTSFHKLFLYDL